MAIAFRPPDPLLTIGEAAALAGVHRNTLRGWCTSGRLPSIRINARGERRIRRSDLDRLLRVAPPKPVARDGRSTARRERRPREFRSTAPTELRSTQRARSEALRRIVDEVSGTLDPARLFDDVLDSSRELFGAAISGLWLLEPGDHPFKLAAHRNLPEEMGATVAAIRRDDNAKGLEAIRARRPLVLDDPATQATTPALARLYAQHGYRTVLFAPLIFREEPMGLLVLYHLAPYDWTADELELAASFANQMATAVANARLYGSVTGLEARLRAIGELSSRLNRITTVDGIGEAIVTEADRLIDHDTIRVYRIDHETRWCEPVAFHGEFLGIGRPEASQLRVMIGQGLTGWVAEHGATLRIGDASVDRRGMQVGGEAGVESMLLVPMSFEDRVLGVIVVSKRGRDAYTEEDERTLTIFAAYASQALANAGAFARLETQQTELRHRLESQRRLLEINEHLLSTLDPTDVLEKIADGLQTVVAYDSLTVYRVDRAAGVRRAVVARDRFAEEILQHEGTLDTGITGWAIQHREAVLANDAHLDDRSFQIPGTPEEPESMVVCPLIVGGDIIGTLNVGRLGGDEAHFSRDEFELVQLFAAQASIALGNAETHGAVVTQADHDALTGLRNHGAFQRDLGEAIASTSRDGRQFAVLMLDLDNFKAYNDRHGHPAGDALLRRIADAMRGALREADRLYRYGGDEFGVVLRGSTAAAASEVGERVRRTVGQLTESDATPVTVTFGVAVHPDDGATKDDLVAAADRALYLAKPSGRSGREADPSRDPYLAALDETALALLERLDPTDLLQAIVERAGALIGTPHGYMYLLDPADAGGELVVRVGTGMFNGYVGYSLPPGEGVGWQVVRTGEPFSVEDYERYANRAHDLTDRFGSVVGVPLRSGDEVVGVIGLASGLSTRRFTEREVGVLLRFAQLASIALDNARLLESAQAEVRERAHAALHDTLTGLPNRELLMERLAAVLERTAVVGHTEARRHQTSIGFALLDLDRFQVVNETLGHYAGDQLLIAAARRIGDAVRAGDVVARFGDDVFALLLQPIDGERDALSVLSVVEASFAEPFLIDDHEVQVTAATGIALGGPGTTVADLLREAEIAAHRAKVDPVRRTILFDPAMRAQAVERVELERDLRRAIERNELVLHYQPLVELVDERIVGHEALLRWQHPTRGLMPPLSFVPLAEETGLILPMGRWVLSTAAWQARQWQQVSPSAGSLVMSVNLSARQFSQPGLVDEVRELLSVTGLDPATLELEITESVVMDESEAGIQRLHILRDLGVRLALDDFGTGYSSLSYLRRLPLDVIKIDRSFVAGLGSPETAEAGGANLPIVQAVIGLAHGLGIEVVAEGIETQEQLELLRQHGCDRGQGYLFARPMPAPDLGMLVEPQNLR
jgi:diguanylate cyclase (GGDEF)-like protein/excisionase family DNA binding protein